MRICLSKTVGLIANVSTNNICLVGYSQNIRFVGSSIDEIRISSTIIVCEVIEGQALVALKLSTQERTYDQAFSKCLGISVTAAAVNFASLEPITRSLYRPTPRPTLSTENSKNYCDTVEVIQ